MASLEFDIGLFDSPTPPETSISRTLTSAASSMTSAVKSKLSDDDSTDQTSSEPISNDVPAFDILRNFLQPDTNLSLEYVIKALLDLLPPDTAEGSTVYSLGCVCVDMAEQIPYHHPSHQKMARVLEHLRKSTKFNEKVILEGVSVYHPYQKLKEYIVDRFQGPEEENPEEYVNLNCFIANLYNAHVFLSDPSLAMKAMRRAFENGHDGEPISIRDAYVLAAAQWILWNGQDLFMQIRYPGDVLPDTKVWTPGKPPSSVRNPFLTLHKWKFWRDCFRAAASEESEAGDECKAVSTKAANMMDAIEDNMSL